MKYAACYRSWLNSPPALHASVEALGVWLKLAAHAADLECGEGEGDVGVGRLVGAAGHGDRQWLTLAGVTSAEVQATIGAGLAVVDGGDLLVGGYDLAGQRAVEKRRDNGRSGGRKPVGKPKPNRPVTRQQTGRVTDCKPEPNPLPSLSSPSLPIQDPARPREAEPTPQPDLRALIAEHHAEQSGTLMASSADQQAAREIAAVFGADGWLAAYGRWRADEWVRSNNPPLSHFAKNATKYGRDTAPATTTEPASPYRGLERLR